MWGSRFKSEKNNNLIIWDRNLINYVAAIFKTIISYAEITFNAHGRGKTECMGLSTYVHVQQFVWINEIII